MAVTLFLVATSVVFGLGVSSRFLGARTRWEALSAAPLIACLAVIACGNAAGGPTSGRPLSIWLTGLGALLLWLWPSRTPPPETTTPPAAPLSKGWKIGLVTLLSLVLGYTLYAQFLTLDTDNWIHEPLIAGYSLGIFPPVHPFFPEIEMHGHYGRDLLVGMLLSPGSDPLAVVWTLNPILALCSCGVLLAIFRRWNDPPAALLCALVLPFFGICVGFRVGLVDSFDGNNGLVYALAILLFYVMLLVLEILPGDDPHRPPVSLWLAAGSLLGTYQLVYETHFGLLLLSGAVLAIPAIMRNRRRLRLTGGIALTLLVALGLACSEGGPFTDLARERATKADSVSLSEAEVNAGQRVSLTFPKNALFQVQATSAEYQRLSPGFRLKSFRHLIPTIEGEGYLNVFSPSFLVSHWLPLFCAPLTLVWLLRRRHWPGLAFWLFGAFAYLVPALVDFGPQYEWEYFRWEFAAGFGFSVPLGLLCGHLLSGGEGNSVWSTDPTRQRLTLSFGRGQLLSATGLVLLVLSLWPGEKMVNLAIIDLQTRGGLPTVCPPGQWRVERPELGVTSADIELAQHLSGQILPHERVLTNLGQETPLGLWPECVLSALTGARVVGRAQPPAGLRLHAHPNYHRSALWRAVMSTSRLDLLWNSGISWLVLDPSKDALSTNLAASGNARLQASFEDPSGGRRELWQLSPLPSLAISRNPSQPPFRSQVLFSDSSGKLRALDQLGEVEWRSGQAYRLRVTAANPQDRAARLGWLRITVSDHDNQAASEPLDYLLGSNPLPPGSGDIHEVDFVTPLSEGQYQVQGGLLAESQTLPLFNFAITLNFLQRLESLKAELEVPGDVDPKASIPLKLKLHSEAALESQEELTLLTRFRRIGGDYVWELDRLATPLNLLLSQGGTQEVEWKVTAPWQEGGYELELEIFDKITGRRVALKHAKAQITVVAP